MEKRIGGRKTKRNQFSCKLCANPHVTGNYGYCLEHRDRIKKNTKNIKSTSSSSSSSLQTAVSSSNSSTVQKNVGRWTQQEKRAFEEGLKHHGRGRWKLFLPLIPTKSQLQIRQVSFPPHVSITSPTFFFSYLKLPIPTNLYLLHFHFFFHFTACLCLL